MSARLMLILAGIAALAVGAFFWFRPKDRELPRAEQKTADSLAITRTGFTARVDTLVLRESIYVRQANEKAAASRQIERAADDLRKAALVAEARADAATDSAHKLAEWVTTAHTYRAEAETLRVALDTQKARATLLESAINDASAQRVLYVNRVAALEDYSKRLERDVKQGDHCRIAHFFGCPSRKSSAVIATVATAAVLTLRPWERLSP